MNITNETKLYAVLKTNNSDCAFLFDYSIDSIFTDKTKAYARANEINDNLFNELVDDFGDEDSAREEYDGMIHATVQELSLKDIHE